jgi:hypothetical protein
LKQVAIVDLASFAVRNSVAIAQIETFRGAIPPDGVLDKTREYLWKARIEGAGINTICGSSDNLGTATHGVAALAVPMGNAAVFLNAGAVQEIVHQGVDSDHNLSGLEPNGPVVARSDQQAG